MRKVKKRILWALLFLSVALVFWPSLAAAQGPDVTMYEVTENTKFVGGTLHRRVATSALQGKVKANTVLCPSSADCDITAVATDNINLGTGKGPVNGSFAIVVNEPPSVDPAEVVVFQGHFTGQIDLSPVLAGMPLGLMTAHLTAPGLGKVPFNGTFRLPFSVGGGNYGYLGNLGVEVATGSEFSLGLPTVRLEANFQ